MASKTKFNWTCDECAGSAPAEWVVLSGVQLKKALDYPIKHPTNTGPTAYTFKDLIEAAEDLGTWTTMCTNHAKQYPDDGYVFETSRIDDASKALDWTLHLMQKSWANNTDWPSFLRKKMEKSVSA